MYTLHYAKNTISVCVHIVLEELGLEYDNKEIRFAEQQQTSADYLAVNPKGRVPTLITPQGSLTETPAILTFLAQCHPQLALLPQEPFAFAQAQSFMAYLASSVHVDHAHTKRGERWSDDPACHASMQAKVASNMQRNAAMIDAVYFKGPWALGQDYSVCDAYLWMICNWIEADGADLSQTPRLVAFMQRMRERPAVQRALALHQTP